MKRIVCLLGILSLFASLRAGVENLKVGDSAAQVEAEMGKPTGKMGRAGKSEIWQYADASIKLEQGSVSSIERRGEAPINAVRTVNATTSEIPKVKEIRDKGASFQMNTLTVPGKVTIVDFFADWCAPCRQISPVLVEIAQQHEDVYVRKVDIVDWETPVVSQYGIRAIPHILVFGRDGKLVGQPSSDPRVVYQHVQTALR